MDDKQDKVSEEMRESFRQMRIAVAHMGEEAKKMPKGHPFRDLFGPLTMINDRVRSMMESFNNNGVIGYTERDMDDARLVTHIFIMSHLCDIVSVNSKDIEWSDDEEDADQRILNDLRAILMKAKVSDTMGNICCWNVERQLDAANG